MNRRDFLVTAGAAAVAAALPSQTQAQAAKRVPLGIQFFTFVGPGIGVPWEKYADPDFKQNVLYAYDKKTGKQLAVFKAEEWDNYGLMVVDSAMIYSIVDVLLGGRRGTAAMRIEGRPYTTIERTLVERLITVVLADLSASFDPICPVTFRFERLEVNPRFATISRLSNAAILARLRIDMEDRGGRFEIVLPYATFEPVRELLLQRFMGEKFGRDNIWEGHLANELWHTEIKIDAVLDEQTMSLNDILQLKVGSRLMLSATPASDIQLRCGPKAMFVGSMGRRGSNMAIRVEQKVKHQEAM